MNEDEEEKEQRLCDEIIEAINRAELTNQMTLRIVSVVTASLIKQIAGHANWMWVGDVFIDMLASELHSRTVEDVTNEKKTE